MYSLAVAALCFYITCSSIAEMPNSVGPLANALATAHVRTDSPLGNRFQRSGIACSSFSTVLYRAHTLLAHIFEEGWRPSGTTPSSNGRRLLGKRAILKLLARMARAVRVAIRAS